MTIQQCKYVLEIARTGSMSEAAKQLFVAQSGLSGAVKQLEQELGIKIFERSKNGVFLTAEGAEFVRYAEQLVTQSEFVLDRYRADADRPRLYVSTQHYDFIADVFCELLREQSDKPCAFSLREIRTFEVIREVETAYSDIGIMAIKDKDLDVMKRYLDKKGIAFSCFLRTPPHVFLRKGHPLAGRRILTASDLKEHLYVCYEQGAHNSSLFTEELAGNTEAGKRVEISDRATLINVLLTTDGYTVGTGIMPSALNNGKIVCVPFESEDFYHIGYICRADRKRSALTERFIALLDAFAEQYR